MSPSEPVSGGLVADGQVLPLIGGIHQAVIVELTEELGISDMVTILQVFPPRLPHLLDLPALVRGQCFTGAAGGGQCDGGRHPGLPDLDANVATEDGAQHITELIIRTRARTASATSPGSADGQSSSC